MLRTDFFTAEILLIYLSFDAKLTWEIWAEFLSNQRTCPSFLVCNVESVWCLFLITKRSINIIALIASFQKWDYFAKFSLKNEKGIQKSSRTKNVLSKMSNNFFNQFLLQVVTFCKTQFQFFESSKVQILFPQMISYFFTSLAKFVTYIFSNRIEPLINSLDKVRVRYDRIGKTL